MCSMASTSVHLFILLCLSFSSIYSQGQHLQGKIVGGEYAKIRSYPHAVFLELSIEDTPTHICGSSILNQYYLISVAHCFMALKENGKILAFAGHENIKKANVIRTSRMAILHRKFDTCTIDNDIALVLLEKPLPLGEHVQRIIIRRNFPRGITGSIAGWGVVNEITEEETILLKAVTQSLQRRRDCRPLGITPSNFCAGSQRVSDARPAAGDSGSGLVTGNYQLIGMLSYKLLMHPALSVYTNVSHHYKWIRQQTKSQFCSL